MEMIQSITETEQQANKDWLFQPYPSFKVVERPTKSDGSYEEQEVSAAVDFSNEELTRVKKEINRLENQVVSKDEEIRLLKDQLNRRDKEIRKLRMIIESAFIDLSRAVEPSIDSLLSRNNISANNTFMSQNHNPATGGFESQSCNHPAMALFAPKKMPHAQPLVVKEDREQDIVGAQRTKHGLMPDE